MYMMICVRFGVLLTRTSQKLKVSNQAVAKNKAFIH